MTSKQKVLEIFPTAKAVWNTAGAKHPRFPLSMIRSAPRHHSLRKKDARHLKGKWHYVTITIPDMKYLGNQRVLSFGPSEVAAWQRVVERFCIELTKGGGNG